MKKSWLFFCLIFGAVKLFSMPINPVVISGEMTSDLPDAKQMNLTVSDKAIVNWESFSIALGERVKFIQPSEMSAVLNRVTGNTTSEIFGTMQALGHVFLINPQGVVIGENGAIGVGGFVASTMDISDTDFLNQNYLFKTPSDGTIINYGRVHSGSGGITFLGRKIENHGEINSQGTFSVGIGEEILLQNDQENRIFIRAKLIETEDANFTDLGQIIALKQEIQASANPYSYAINLDGEISKYPILEKSGKFYLKADGGKVVITKSIQQADCFISGQEILVKKDAIINTQNKGSINFAFEDYLDIEGKCITTGGDIRINKLEGRGTLVHRGLLDVSANCAGKIELDVNYFSNAGVIKANSQNIAGEIKITADRIIDVADAKVLCRSSNKKGGKIEVIANERFYSSGTYLAKGSKEGGLIKINAKNIVLMSPTLDVAAEKHGLVVLEPLEGYYETEHTKLLGQINKEKLILLKSDPLTGRLLKGNPFSEYDLYDPNEGIGSGFGREILVLSSGNIVVAKTKDDLGAITDTGSVYFYNGTTRQLVSTLRGSTTGDTIGSGGLLETANGDFVVLSPNWDNTAVPPPSPPISVDAGAATWCSGIDGRAYGETSSIFSVSNTNSLVGVTASDHVSSGGAIALNNGNYVVLSPSWNWLFPFSAGSAGAATWCSSDGSTLTPILSANNLGDISLSSIASNSNIGGGGAIALTTGDYVVLSPNLNFTATQQGAATWCNGSNGNVWGTGAPSATVSLGNSLIGSVNYDHVGGGGAIALANGNYVVLSPGWNNGVSTTPPTIPPQYGAVTWCPSTGTGNVAVSGANSLTGSAAGNQVGSTGSGNPGAIALNDPNGDYVVFSSNWSSVFPGVNFAGAATWCDGSNGHPFGGISPGLFVSTANSLYGSNVNDYVGYTGGIALTNGNYVVFSPQWNSNLGAATLVDGNTGIPINEVTGNVAVSQTNSLVGVNSGDQVGSNGGVALTNGNYVVVSLFSGGAVLPGAVTWGDGNVGVTNNVSTANSIIGNASDQLGLGGIVPLTDGNYVVLSPDWNDPSGPTSQVGAATWADGTSPLLGTLDATNSLIGTTMSDRIGSGGAVAMPNGRYVVSNINWDDGLVSDVGAATFAEHAGGIVGYISVDNSVIGRQANSKLFLVTPDFMNDTFLVTFNAEHSGSGRVTIVIPFIPVPPIPFSLTDAEKAYIDDQTIAARAELFRYLHPYNEYIKKYISYSIKQKSQKLEIFDTKRDYRRFILKEISDTLVEIKSYFIRQRTDNTSELLEEKTL